MSDDRISLTDAAKRLGVSRVTAWRWAREGKLKAQKIGGRAYTTLVDIEEFRKNHIVDMAETPSKISSAPALS